MRLKELHSAVPNELLKSFKTGHMFVPLESFSADKEPLLQYPRERENDEDAQLLQNGDEVFA